MKKRVIVKPNESFQLLVIDGDNVIADLDLMIDQIITDKKGSKIVFDTSGSCLKLFDHLNGIVKE